MRGAVRQAFIWAGGARQHPLEPRGSGGAVRLVGDGREVGGGGTEKVGRFSGDDAAVGVDTGIDDGL